MVKLLTGDVAVTVGVHFQHHPVRLRQRNARAKRRHGRQAARLSPSHPVGVPWRRGIRGGARGGGGRSEYGAGGAGTVIFAKAVDSSFSAAAHGDSNSGVQKLSGCA